MTDVVSCAAAGDSEYNPQVVNTFVALDVETANSSYASICAVGLCRFEDGLEVDRWFSLLDPCADFSWRNTEIHGIRAGDVAGQPRFAEVLSELGAFVDGQPVVHHGHFDRNAIGQASQVWQLPTPDWRFIDSLTAAKQAWPERRGESFRLPDLCREIGHELVHHHNALDDARGAGAIFLAARERLSDDRIAAMTQQIPQPGDQRQLWDDAVDLSLLRDFIVFSKDASTLTDDVELMTTLKARGAIIQHRLSDATTIYVVSNAEWLSAKSSSQRRGAGQRVGSGQRLQIMSETDFLAMIEHS